MLANRVRNAWLENANAMSVVSYREVVLKVGKGKLDVGEPRSWWAGAMKQLNANVLTLRPGHSDD